MTHWTDPWSGLVWWCHRPWTRWPLASETSQSVLTSDVACLAPDSTTDQRTGDWLKTGLSAGRKMSEAEVTAIQFQGRISGLWFHPSQNATVVCRRCFPVKTGLSFHGSFGVRILILPPQNEDEKCLKTSHPHLLKEGNKRRRLAPITVNRAGGSGS